MYNNSYFITRWAENQFLPANTRRAAVAGASPSPPEQCIQFTERKITNVYIYSYYIKHGRVSPNIFRQHSIGNLPVAAGSSFYYYFHRHRARTMTMSSPRVCVFCAQAWSNAKRKIWATWALALDKHTKQNPCHLLLILRCRRRCELSVGGGSVCVVLLYIYTHLYKYIYMYI